MFRDNFLKFFWSKLPTSFKTVYYFPSLIILVLYFGAILNQLQFTFYLVAMLIALLSCKFLVRFSISRVGNLHRDTKILFIYLTSVILTFRAIPNDFRFLAWDELSGWASRSKNVYLDNSLWTIESTMLGKFYPPGQELFHYFVLQFTSWNEKIVLFSQSILILSCVALIVQKFKSDRFGVLITIFTCVVLSAYSLNFGFYTILPDFLIALYFGILLLHSFGNNRLINWGWLLLATVTVVLKPYGLVFVLISWVIYFLRNGLHSRLFKRAGIYWLFHLMPPLIAYASWRFWMSQNGISNVSQGIGLDNLFNIENRTKIRLTFLAFKDNLFSFDDYAQGGFNLISTTSLLLILLSLFLFLAITSSFFGWRDFSLVLLSFVLFELFLFASYILFFSSYESTRVASMTRYNSALFLALLILLLVKFEDLVMVTKSAIFKILAFILVIGLVFGGRSFFSDLIKIDKYKDAIPQRNSLEAFVSGINESQRNPEKTYFIDQGTIGYTMWMFRYLAIPRITNSWCWSVGVKYFDEDVWTCQDKAIDRLKGFGNLAIYNGDDNFWNWIRDSGIGFDTRLNRGLYLIETDLSGNPSNLRLVGALKS